MASSRVIIDTNTPPVLIIDKEGFFGYLIAEKLRQFTNVVFVSGKIVAAGKKLLSLPFGRVLSHIPAEIYSHIFFIPQGSTDIADHLDVLVKKAREDKAQLVIILEKGKATKDIQEMLKTSVRDALIIVLGDVFGKGVPTLSGVPGELPALLALLKKEKSIKLPNMGLHAYYPVSVQDAFAEIIKLSFATAKKGYYLIYPNFPSTQLGVVRCLQQVDPEITIDFFPSFAKATEGRHEIIEGTFVLPDAYDVFSKIQEAYKDTQELRTKNKELIRDILDKGNKEDKSSSASEPQFWQSEKKKTVPAWIVAFLVCVITFLFCFIAVPVFLAFRGLQSVSDARLLLEKGNVTAATAKIHSSIDLFRLSSKIVRAGGVIGIADWLDRTTDTLNNVSFLTDAVAILQKGDNPYAGISLLKKGFANLAQEKNLEFIPSEVNSFVATLKKMAPFVVDNTDAFVDAFGLAGERKYLILFQNNMELRPGGGFIGSYAIAKINKAKLDLFTISDVYDADGQLKAHIEPPFPVRRYLGKVHSYLRDSNFDVDFPKDAYSSAFLLQLETGEKVDGVIAVDLSFARDLLGAVGGVYMPDYNVVVTTDNFFSLAEKYAEKDFFPGSSQKKDFLRSVFAALQQQVVTKGFRNSQAILGAAINGIKNKHILFVSGNPGLEDLLVANNLSGSIWDGRIVSGNSNTFLDSAGINEANIGVNKVNAFITRSVSQDLQITQSGSISGTLSMRYKNASDGSWPGGEYAAYAQVILPLSARIQNIVIDGVTQRTIPAITDFLIYEKQGFVSPGGLEVSSSIENNKAVFGFLIHVPEKSEKRVDIIYNLPTTINLQQPLLTYDLLYQKQPGTDEYPYEATITVPDNYTYYQSTGGFTGSSSQATFIGNISTDKRLIVTFRKK